MSAEEYHKRFTEVEDKATSAYASANIAKVAARSTLKLQQFDPNDLNLQGWISLGFSPKQAQSILNFKAKAGHFRSLRDLQMLYVMSPQKFEQLKDYVVINSREPIPANWSNQNNRNTQRASFSKTNLLDMNEADSLDWVKLKGIGPVFASRIIKYRNKLGGFYSPDQLLEVYGLDSNLYNLIRPNLVLEAADIRQISVNQASYSTLRNHPYFSAKAAQVLVNYIHQHGPLKSAEDLKKVYIFDAALIEKLTPYLHF